MNNYSELSAFRIHSLLLDSIVKLTSAVRKEGQAISNPLEIVQLTTNNKELITMANNCFVDFYISTRTNTEAAKLIEILYKNISEANKRNEGAFIGSKTRYIFDAGVYSHTPVVVKLEGWVRWSIDYTEIKDIIDWINTFVSVTKINMRYEETGMYLYGEYIYNNTGRKGKQLCDKYVEEKDFPPDFTDENYYEKLEQIFQKKATIKYIPFH